MRSSDGVQSITLVLREADAAKNTSFFGGIILQRTIQPWELLSMSDMLSLDTYGR